MDADTRLNSRMPMKKFYTGSMRLSTPRSMAGLELAGLVALVGAMAETAAQNLANGLLRERAGDVDADFLAVVLLAEGDEGAHDFLAWQNAADPAQPLQTSEQALAAVKHSLRGVRGVAQHERRGLLRQRAH